jgi:two-component system, OmpR family, KDP operon response regulator KdpE
VAPKGGARILIVDDEPTILRTLTRNLAAHGFDVSVAETGAVAVERYRARRPDLVILDLGLPDISGTEVIREIRRHANTPIIVLSVREAELDKVAALDLGADDYLTKPFGVEELLARIRVALRHVAGPASGDEPIFRTGELEVDTQRRRVTVDGESIHLTPTEYEILKAFVANPDRVLTEQALLRAVWGPEYGNEAHYLHVYMARLRKKIEPDARRPRYLVTEPGVGYRLMSALQEHPAEH